MWNLVHAYKPNARCETNFYESKRFNYTFSTAFTFLRHFLPLEPLLSSWWSESAAFFNSFAFLPSSVASYSVLYSNHRMKLH